MAKKTDSYAGATVQLADQETSFFDPQTQFSVTREEKAKVGDTIGRKTNTAIVSGRLLVVKGGRMLGAGQDETDGTDAPTGSKPASKGGQKAAAKE